jgi:hypothetical protein
VRQVRNSVVKFNLKTIRFKEFEKHILGIAARLQNVDGHCRLPQEICKAAAK